MLAKKTQTEKQNQQYYSAVENDAGPVVRSNLPMFSVSPRGKQTAKLVFGAVEESEGTCP